jgi:hypothetical protein
MRQTVFTVRLAFALMLIRSRIMNVSCRLGELEYKWNLRVWVIFITMAFPIVFFLTNSQTWKHILHPSHVITAGVPLLISCGAFAALVLYVWVSVRPRSGGTTQRRQVDNWRLQSTNFGVTLLQAPNGSLLPPSNNASAWRAADGTCAFVQPEIALLFVIMTAMLGALPAITLAALASIGTDNFFYSVNASQWTLPGGPPAWDPDSPTAMLFSLSITISLIAMIGTALRCFKYLVVKEEIDVNSMNIVGADRRAAREGALEMNAIALAPCKSDPGVPSRMVLIAIVYSAVATPILLTVHMLWIWMSTKSGSICDGIPSSTYSIHNNGGPIRAVYIGYCSMIIFLANFLIFRVWLCNLPSDPVRQRMKQLTADLKSIRRAQEDDGSVNTDASREGTHMTLSTLFERYEAWFFIRNETMMWLNHPQYRQIEMCLLGDASALVALCAFMIFRFIPNLLSGDGFLGDVVGLSTITIILWGLITTAVALWAHSWGIIYGHANETSLQQREFEKVQWQAMSGTRMFARIPPLDHTQLISMQMYIAGVQARLQSQHENQPTVFGLRVEPTHKNTILVTAGSVFVATLVGIFHKFF